MFVRRLLALCALVAVVMGSVPSPALALSAPGAKITREEAALSTVRLIDREAEAEGLSEAEVAALLSTLPDGAEVSDWARHAVALFVKLGVVSKAEPFAPLTDASRLDVAVMLVSGLGLGAEARARQAEGLPYTDGHLVAPELTGYVAVAAERGLISGYDGRTFRPHQGVKRIEMASMAGQAATTTTGTVTALTAETELAPASLTLLQEGVSAAYAVSSSAVVTVNDRSAVFADLKTGDNVTLTLVAGVVSRVAASREEGVVVEGSIVGLTAPGTVSLIYTLDDSTVFANYLVGASTKIYVNGQPATFQDLLVDDAVKATLLDGNLVKLEVLR